MDGVNSEEERNFQPGFLSGLLQHIGLFDGQDVQEGTDLSFTYFVDDGLPFHTESVGVDIVHVVAALILFFLVSFHMRRSDILTHLPDFLFECHLF